MDQQEKTIAERLAELRSILGMFQHIVITQQAELDALQRARQDLAEEKKALIQENQRLEAKWKNDHQPLIDGTQALSGIIERLNDIIKIEDSRIEHRKAKLDEREAKLKDLEEHAPAKTSAAEESDAGGDRLDKKVRKRYVEDYPRLLQENGRLQARIKELETTVANQKTDIKAKADLIEELKKQPTAATDASASAEVSSSTSVPIFTGGQGSYSGYQNGYPNYGRSDR